MEAVLSTIPFSKKANVKDYVTSLHFFPVLATAALSPAIYMAGHPQLAFVTLYSGLAILALLTWLMPVLTVKPVCGAYRVGVKELNAARDAAGNGCPPLTVFFPTATKEAKTSNWVPFMDHGYLRGLASHLHLPYFVVRDLQLNRLEAQLNAEPLRLLRKDGSQRPIFVMSHGMGAFTRMYCCFITSIAAQGGFIVGVNHTDGSSSFCRDGTNDFRIPMDRNLGRTYYDRESQMRTRVREMQGAIAGVLDGSILRRLGVLESDIQAYVSNNPQIVLLGHSYGGCTVLATAHEEEKKMRAKKESFWKAIAGVLAYDPWRLPLWGRFIQAKASDGVEPTGDLLNFTEEAATYSVPTLMHISQEGREDEASWGYYTSLFKVMHDQIGKKGLLLPAQKDRIEAATARVQKALKPSTKEKTTTAPPPSKAQTATEANMDRPSDPENVEDWFILHTAIGSSHMSISDLPFLSPVLFKKSYQTNHPEVPIHQWSNEVMRFAEIHVEKNMNL